ncbi:MAG: hypothetical protein HN736_01840 [Anaerolineae bacterium]|jgi:uncharacterized protein YraI|nr:hypothetical protein [Anaerolineae bacterium]MBT4310887.1 hypothetical protein [Anaerolineae bacterium]MBT4458251.1 hypothetical protein [Anaerolineae bacterium]MBT4840994.1 hypothetical protein [Anaerolineae bacterium]MBT6061132.1 hypothetical protein [Anaerolineae bacterium]
MKKITKKYNKQSLIAIVMLIAFLAQACLQTVEKDMDAPQSSPAVSETSTWTPSPASPTALPTATKTPISNTPTASPAPTQVQEVVFTVSGGNLNMRRGSDLAYNFVGVLYDGDVADAIGRDRRGDWLLVELPSNPDMKGWVTTETEYSSVEGNIKSLPLVEVEAALPAFIRNCTKHTILVQPGDVQLLNKYNEADNEGHFDVLTYQIYDLDVAGSPRLEDVRLAEGKRVDINNDGNGDKSKCE